MNENNLPNIDGEENTAPIEDTNEVVDEIEAVEDEIFVPVDEDAEPAEPAEETSEPAAFSDIAEPAEVKKGSGGKIAAIVIIIVAVLAIAAVCVYKIATRNPYNNMGYINVSGRTIGEVASQAGYNSVDEFLAEYGLPADMPEDTEESAAYYSIPVSKIAQMYGMEVADLKELLGLGDDVTDTTPWGEAEGKATLAKYIGEDNLDEFKQEYGLGDEITGETLWGEVRNIVDKKTLEAQKAAADAEKNNADNSTPVGDEDVSGDQADGGEKADDNATPAE